MEMHQLRYVIALARTGSFSRAAEQCHVAQPSLSQQVRKLEEELGHALFERRRLDTRLTPHGQAFLPRAIRILDEVDAARREADESQGLLRGTVTIGALPTIAPYLLPAIVARYRSRHPGIKVVINEDTTEHLERLLLACEIDFMLASLPLRDERIEIQPLLAEELLLALPARHPLARKRSLRPADLEGQPLIVMKKEHCLGDQVLGFCDSRDIRAQISFRSGQLETILAFVNAGLGISLIPRLAARRLPAGGIVYRSLGTPRPRRQIVAAWQRQHPPGRATGELLRMLRAARGHSRGS